MPKEVDIMLIPMALCPECGGSLTPDIIDQEAKSVSPQKWFIMARDAQQTDCITLWCRNKGFCSIADSSAQIRIRLPKWKAQLIAPMVPRTTPPEEAAKI